LSIIIKIKKKKRKGKRKNLKILLINFYTLVYTGQKSLYLDDEGVFLVMKKGELKNETNLKEYNLTKATATLINSIILRTKSIIGSRETVKGHKLPPGDSYDHGIHADMTFIENIRLYL
jgi:hypothetical protein